MQSTESLSKHRKLIFTISELVVFISQSWWENSDLVIELKHEASSLSISDNTFVLPTT